MSSSLRTDGGISWRVRRQSSKPPKTEPKNAMRTIPRFLLVLLLIGAGCEKTPETLIKRGYDQKEMAAAIARARGEVNDFIKVLAEKNADSFSVKAPITDAHGTEHFWIT